MGMIMHSVKDELSYCLGQVMRLTTLIGAIDLRAVCIGLQPSCGLTELLSHH